MQARRANAARQQLGWTGDGLVEGAAAGAGLSRRTGSGRAAALLSSALLIVAGLTLAGVLLLLLLLLRVLPGLEASAAQQRLEIERLGRSRRSWRVRPMTSAALCCQIVLSFSWGCVRRAGRQRL